MSVDSFQTVEFRKIQAELEILSVTVDSGNKNSETEKTLNTLQQGLDNCLLYGTGVDIDEMTQCQLSLDRIKNAFQRGTAPLPSSNAGELQPQPKLASLFQSPPSELAPLFQPSSSEAEPQKVFRVSATLPSLQSQSRPPQQNPSNRIIPLFPTFANLSLQPAPSAATLQQTPIPSSTSIRQISFLNPGLNPFPMPGSFSSSPSYSTPAAISATPTPTAATTTTQAFAPPQIRTLSREEIVAIISKPSFFNSLDPSFLKNLEMHNPGMYSDVMHSYIPAAATTTTQPLTTTATQASAQPQPLSPQEILKTNGEFLERMDLTKPRGHYYWVWFQNYTVAHFKAVTETGTHLMTKEDQDTFKTRSDQLYQDSLAGKFVGHKEILRYIQATLRQPAHAAHIVFPLDDITAKHGLLKDNPLFLKLLEIYDPATYSQVAHT